MDVLSYEQDTLCHIGRSLWHGTIAQKESGKAMRKGETILLRLIHGHFKALHKMLSQSNR